MNNETELCVKNGFFVKIKPIKTGGCIAEFPPNLIVGYNEPKQTTYLQGNDYLEIYKNTKPITIKLAKHLLRPAMVGHILKESHSRQIHHSLILIDSNGKYCELSSNLHLLPTTLTKEEQVKELQVFCDIPVLVYGKAQKATINSDSADLYDFLFNGGL